LVAILRALLVDYEGLQGLRGFSCQAPFNSESFIGGPNYRPYPIFFHLKGEIEKALPPGRKNPGQMFPINLSKLLLKEMTMKGVQ